MKISRLFFAVRLLPCLLACAVWTPAHADGGIDDGNGGQILQRLLQQDAPDSHAATDDNVRLTPDENRIIRLDRDAATVIVTNPAHADAKLDNTRLLVVFPRTPGTTQLTVLDAAGEVILRKNVVVSGTARNNYVRIRRACTGGDCNETNYYYCPDGCYEVQAMPADSRMKVPTVNPAAAPPAPPPPEAPSEAVVEE